MPGSRCSAATAEDITELMLATCARRDRISASVKISISTKTDISPFCAPIVHERLYYIWRRSRITDSEEIKSTYSLSGEFHSTCEERGVLVRDAIEIPGDSLNEIR